MTRRIGTEDSLLSHVHIHCSCFIRFYSWCRKKQKESNLMPLSETLNTKDPIGKSLEMSLVLERSSKCRVINQQRFLHKIGRG